MLQGQSENWLFRRAQTCFRAFHRIHTEQHWKLTQKISEKSNPASTKVTRPFCYSRAAKSIRSSRISDAFRRSRSTVVRNVDRIGNRVLKRD